ncbi:MAG: hypothetical protein IIZ12_01390 [Eggerthellaceae bacterium]|nr:hypothetical protein [Eggerthellaceae bacterium]
MAYADVSDLESRWRELTDEEQARATVLLDDASAMLAASVTVDETDEQQMALLKIVTCNMVQRSMSTASGDTYGVSQQSMTAVGFTQQYTYTNPTGDLYITKSEKRLLGISGTGKGRTLIYGMAGDDDESV